MNGGQLMACRINQLNKNTSVTYVYESVSFWDKKRSNHETKKYVLANSIQQLRSSSPPSA
jgi:hypothetical protein